MSYLNNYITIIHFLLLANLIRKEKIELGVVKIFLMFLGALIFAIIEVFFSSISDPYTSSGYSYLLTLIYIIIAYRNDFFSNLMLSTCFVTINKTVLFIIALTVEIISGSYAVVVFGQNDLMIILTFIISIFTYSIYNDLNVNIFQLSKAKELFIPFIMIHIVMDVAGTCLLSSSSNSLSIVLYTLLFICSIIVYISVFHTSTLNKIISNKNAREKMYQEELLFLESIITSYQNNNDELHDMFALLLKYQEEHEDIQNFLGNKKPKMRIFTADQNFNYVLNMLINMEQYSELQIDTLIINPIEIEKQDLLIFLYEIFKISDNNKPIKIFSSNYLEISFKIKEDMYLSEQLKNIVKKYRGIINEGNTIINLFYH